MDRNIIQRVLRAYLPRVRFCYERRLLSNPQLSGRLDVAFTIDSSGAVIQAHATGLDASVARCVEQVFRVMRFPQPRGGGVIQVRYPFIFSQSSGATIGNPFGPPSVPPAPTPHAVVQASDPLPEAPLPAPVIAAAHTGEPSGPAGCVALEHPDGLESITDAVEACYGQALQGRAGLITRLEVTARVDDDGRIRDPVVSGKGALSACVASAVQSALLSGAGADEVRGRQIAFTLALDREGGAPPPEQRVVATAHDLRLGLRSIASEVPWREVGTLQLQAWRQIRVDTKGNDAPLVLRADNDLSSGVVLAALATLPGRGKGLRFARDRGDGDWKLVNPLGGATTPKVCGAIGPTSRVTVLVDGSGFWLATKRGYARVPREQGQWNLIGFARQLRTIRREELHDRSDLELAVTSGVPYEVFAKTLEIAIETGFFDATVKSSDAIANPRNRPPRR